MRTPSPYDDARSCWESERRREALDLMWQWDPLGILGVADFYYDSLAAVAVEALASGDGVDALADALKAQVLRLASGGFSDAAASRSTSPTALAEVVERLSTWWSTVPSPPERDR